VSGFAQERQSYVANEHERNAVAAGLLEDGRRRRSRRTLPRPRNNPHDEEQKILIGSIRAGQPVNHQDTMIDSTYTAIMGQIACYTGKPVTWDEIIEADFEFEPKLADVRLDMEGPTQPDATGNYPLPIPGNTYYF
jgi:hypothetical protein